MKARLKEKDLKITGEKSKKCNRK